MGGQHGDNMGDISEVNGWRQHQDHVGQCGGTHGHNHGDNIEYNLDLIEIIQFCLKIYDLVTHPHPHLWVGVWVVGWMGGLICGSMGGVMSYQ